MNGVIVMKSDQSLRLNILTDIYYLLLDRLYLCILDSYEFLNLCYLRGVIES